MIQINLLPVRQIKQRIRARQELAGLVGALLLLLVGMAAVAYGLASHITGLQAETARLTQEKSKYQAVIAEIEKLKRDQAVIETKLAVIKGLKSASQLPARVLDEIARLTPPDRVWLTSFDYGGAVLTLNAVALDNATIADYMDKIGKSDLFTGAELKNSSLTLVGNQKLKSFSLTVNVLTPPPPPGAAAAPAGKK